MTAVTDLMGTSMPEAAVSITAAINKLIAAEDVKPNWEVTRSNSFLFPV